MSALGLLLREAAAAGLILLPVFALRGLLRRGAMSGAERTAAAWFLGPWAWTGLVGVARLAGLSLPSGAIVVTAAAALALLAPLLSRRDAGRGGGLIPGTAAALGVSLLLAAAFFLLRGWETRLWDSTFHGHIASFLRHADLPPENPFLAGKPLVYPWFMHFQTAALGSLTGLDPWHVFPTLNLHALAGTALALALLCPAPTRTGRGVALGVLFAIWAPNSIGWLAHAGRWFFGGETGPEAVRQSIRDFNTVLSQMSPGFDARLAFPAHKFLESTPFALALPAPFLCIRFIGRLLRERSFGSWILLALVLAAWLHIHFMSAVLLAPALAIAAAAGALLNARDVGAGRSFTSLAVAASAVVLAAAISAAYLSATLEPSLDASGGNSWALGLHGENAIAVLFCLLPFAFFMAVEQRGAAGRGIPVPSGDSGLPRGWLATCAAACLVTGNLIVITDHNEYKILLTGLMIIPVLAAPALERLLRGWSPSSLLHGLAAGYIALTGVGIVLTMALISAWRPPRTDYPDEPAASALIERVAPPGAVLVTDAFLPEEMTGPGYLLYPSLQGQWGFGEELRAREEILAILKGGPLFDPLGRPFRAEDPVAPRALDRKAAWEEIEGMGRPVVFALAKGSWPLVPRERLRTLIDDGAWEILLLEAGP